MPKFINPLLADIRQSKMKPIFCTRVYTTVCKNGSFRVKFYNVDDEKVRARTWHIRIMLTKLGWKNILMDILSSGIYPRDIRSFVIHASK